MPKPRSQPKVPSEQEISGGLSPLARASQWTSRIMTISLEMVLPGLAGYWLDQKLGTKALFMLVGFALGGTAAFGHLMYLARRPGTFRSGTKTSSLEAESEGKEET